jgi:RES domain-containing protein
MTAVREANQVGNLQPTTLVCYDAEINGIFNCAKEAALLAEGIDAGALSAFTWRDEMRSSGEARTQTFARTLVAKGYNGLLVQSFAPGSSDQDLNLVLWRWGDGPPVRLTLIDDEGRLTR